MIQFHLWKPRCVERNCIFTFGRFEELALADEQELSFRINEAADQPWAGDTIHFDIFTRNPFHNRPESIEDCHQVVLFAREKSTMMLRVKRHSVIALAVPDGISTYNFVSRRIDDREDVLVLQVDVYLTGYWIVLRHSGFTVEM